MKTKFRILISIFISLFFLNCPKEKDDKTGENLILLNALSGPSLTTTNQSAQARSSVSAVTSSVVSAARNNQVSFHLPLNMKKKDMLAYINSQIVRANRANLLSPQVRPTAITSSGGSCNSSGCTNVTLNGTSTCASGGNYTLTNMKLTLSFPSGSFSSLSFNTTLDGTIRTDKCGSYSVNYFNYPNYVSSITSGTMTISGKSNITYSDYTFAAGSNNKVINVSYSLDENMTINSSGLDIGGGTTVALSDVKSITTLASVGQISDITSSSTATSFTINFATNETLTGTVSLSGSIGGAPANTTKVFAGEKFNYTVSCTISSSASTGTCEVTKK